VCRCTGSVVNYVSSPLRGVGGLIVSRGELIAWCGVLIAWRGELG